MVASHSCQHPRRSNSMCTLRALYMLSHEFYLWSIERVSIAFHAFFMYFELILHTCQILHATRFMEEMSRLPLPLNPLRLAKVPVAVLVKGSSFVSRSGLYD
jgi:hypothetical protein